MKTKGGRIYDAFTFCISLDSSPHIKKKKKVFGVWIQALNLKASSICFFIQLDILMVYWHVRCVWIQALKSEFWT